MNRLLLLVSYKARPGMRKNFLHHIFASGILNKIRGKDGFCRYDYYLDAKDDDTILLIEEWSTEEHQQKHLQTSHMEELKKIKDQYITETKIERFLL